MTAIIFDTETTGLDEPEIIESAWMGAKFCASDENPDVIELTFGIPIVKRFKPGKPISMGAMCTHHIMDEDLLGEPPSASFKLPRGLKYMIGHNVDFDWKVAGSPENVKRIDTLSLARRYLPECDSHKLGALTYYINRINARAELQSAHSAETDIMLTGALLSAILERTNVQVQDFETLWELSEQSRVPTVMMFGKHKGMPIAQVPPDYKAWYLRQAVVDPYVARAFCA
jgi:exodeoxyribonuclease X